MTAFAASQISVDGNTHQLVCICHVPCSAPVQNQFLDAALALVRTKGFAATTIDDVCNRAELTKGSFFHHFSGKEELAVEPRSTGAR